MQKRDYGTGKGIFLMIGPRDRYVQIRRHWEMLVVASLVLLLSFVLEVREDGRVIVTGFGDYPLPHTCMSYAWFGFKCPGCGLTRSIVQLAHRNWLASWQYHRLGWLMALAILLQFPYRWLCLCRGGPSPLGTVFPQVFGYTLIALLMGNWLLGLLWQ
jgi:hypothetical protein